MRIRSIKPEFWKSERLAGLPREVRLLFIGLWNLADDHGRFRAHPNLVRGELFPYDDDVSVADVRGWIDQLVQNGRVRLYAHAGQQYGVVCNFREHQKIDKRTPSRLPPPPGEEPEQGGDVPADPDPPPPSPAGKVAEPADSPAEPADYPAKPAEEPGANAGFTPTDQGAGIREGNREHGPSLPSRAGRGRSGQGREGAVAPQGDPEPEREPEAVSAEGALRDALIDSPYRSKLPLLPRRHACSKAAAKLHAAGCGLLGLDQLVRDDAEKAKQRGALLSTWIDDDTWREQLDERAARDKEAGIRARAPRHGHTDREVYGSPDPKPIAASVAAVIPPRAAGGAA